MSNQSDKKAIIYLFLFTAFAMLATAHTSPLVNASTISIDSSVFITAGRAIASGKIMYKEIFDHKGLYLHFINALGALISGKSLIGLWLIEV